MLHSTTKYLGGHSDVIGGFVATSDDALSEQLAFLQKSLGAVPGPFDCWLVLRGVKTLAVRMDRQCENAVAIAAVLERHPRVERVLYPGLPSHPGHTIAARQMRNFGAMVSFLARQRRRGGRESSARTKIWKLAESLGGVESLIELPARMTHASTADAPFAVPPSLIRLSVGHRGGRRPDRRSRGGTDRVTCAADRPPPPGARHRRLYVLDTPGGPALFDCGPTSTLPYLKAGLAERGLDVSEVKHLLLSHIHLDHAGAAESSCGRTRGCRFTSPRSARRT